MRSARKIVVLGLTFELTCTKSKIEAKTEVTKGNPRLPGRVFDYTLEECKNEAGKKCTIAAGELPWQAHVEHLPSFGGRLTVSEAPPGAAPTAEVVSCEGTTTFNCSYKVSEAHKEMPGLSVANLELFSGSSPSVVAPGVKLLPILKVPKCAVEEVRMYGQWVLSQPGSLWVSYVE